MHYCTLVLVLTSIQAYQCASTCAPTICFVGRPDSFECDRNVLRPDSNYAVDEDVRIAVPTPLTTPPQQLLLSSLAVIIIYLHPYLLSVVCKYPLVVAASVVFVDSVVTSNQ